MGHMLFAAVASGPGPRAARRAALPISLAAHAIAVGALLALPLLAGSAPPPVVTRAAQDPVVLVLPAPPAPAPVVRPSAPPARASAPRAATAPAPVAAAPTITVPVQAPSQVADDAREAACTGCTLTLPRPGTGNGVGSVPGGDGGGGGGGAPTGPWRVGGRISTPVKLRQVDPEYPALARAAGVQGTVVVECIIGTDGHVKDARVLTGRPLLNEAALAAVRRWLYRPTLLDGAPVAVQMTVTVEFHLR